MGYIGKSIPQYDSYLKVTGTATYAFDIELAGMLYAKLVTSPHAHARIVKVDTSKAQSVPGVVAVATGAEFPYRLGIYVGDRDVLAVDKVRWVGHPVAAVIAESLEAAERGIDQVEVEYEPLPGIFDPGEALKPNAPIIHERMSEYRVSPAFKPIPGTNIANQFKLVRGDAERGLQEADVIIEGEFDIPHVSHGFMELQSIIADYKKDGTVEIWTSTQSPFSTRYLMALSLGIPVNKVIIKAPLCGGGFGGKVGIGWEPLVALLSKKAGYKPVKLVLSRKEQFCSAPVREGFHASVKAGFKKDGKLFAYKARFVMDAGGYADYTVNVCRAAGYSSEGCYEVPNIQCESLAVYTTKVPTSAMRGFGYPESHWALERVMDMAAEKLKLDPVEIRLKNLLKPGISETGTGERLREDAGDPVSVAKSVAKSIGWGLPSQKPTRPGRFRGKGMALCLKGPAQPPNAAASAIIKFNEDVSVDLLIGTGSFGQGTPTGLCQLVADELGIPFDKVHVGLVRSTDTSAYTWQTVGSRGLFTDGAALIDAAKDAKDQIREVAAQVLKVRPEELEIADERVFVSGVPWHGLQLSEVVFGYTYPDGRSIGGPIIGRGKFMSALTTYLDPDTGQGVPTIFHTFGGTGVEVEVDVLTGDIEIIKASQAYDVGKAINPLLLKGQIDGGFIMGQSVALHEEILFDEQGWVLNPNLSNYKILRAKEVPSEIDGILIETPQKDGPHGARGIGELVMIGVAPAIANAIFHAIGVQITKLPMSPENVWRAIQQQRPELIEEAKNRLKMSGGN
ncbi:MAG: xanthine dehydrogenase family protein molybdopterin-binding subunit [Candidatus Bathyarchaeia archaeon]|jgi:carbon-monoxide dehydrogenase large subunit